MSCDKEEKVLKVVLLGFCSLYPVLLIIGGCTLRLYAMRAKSAVT